MDVNFEAVGLWRSHSFQSVSTSQSKFLMFDPKAHRFSFLDFLFSNEKDKKVQNSQSWGRSLVSALSWIAELPSLVPHGPVGIYSVGWSRPQSSSLYQPQAKEKKIVFICSGGANGCERFCHRCLTAALCQVTVFFSEPHVAQFRANLSLSLELPQH